MKSKIFIFTCLILVFFTKNVRAESDGYHIEVNSPALENGTVAYLGTYLYGQSYALDSAKVLDNIVIFQSGIKLEQGQYFVFAKPNSRIELLIGSQSQDIKIKISPLGIQHSSIVGSRDSELLWKSIIYQQSYRENLRKLEEKKNIQNISDVDRNTILSEIDLLHKDARSYLLNEVEEHSTEWFGVFTKMSIPVFPPIKSDASVVDLNEGRIYLKKHFFDNVDLQDPRFWNTAFFTRSIDRYMSSCIESVPDSLAAAASWLVSKTEGNDICFKNMLSYFTNKSLESKIVGQENIWARLCEDYIFKRNLPWIDNEQMNKLKSRYEHIRFNRIGMEAKNIVLQSAQGGDINTNDIDASYTLLYFYDPDCALCQTQTPDLYDNVYKLYKSKGFKVVAISVENNMAEWKAFIKDKQIDDWINCIDVDSKSRYWVYYNIADTPSMFLLDNNKKIVSKNIGNEDLKKLLNYFYSEGNGTN